MRRLTTLPMMTAAAMCCAPATFAGDVWDAQGATDFWTNGFNWNPSSGLNQFPPPNNGSANLSFPCFGGVVHQPLIDIPYSINSLTFGSGSGRYVILGAADLTVGAGGIVNNDADIQSIIGTVKLAANQDWVAQAGPLGFDAVNLNGFSLTCTGDFPIGLPSVIVGNGSVNVAGGIQVTMSGGNNNSFTGDTRANNGTLVLQKTGGALAVPGNLTINESEPATPATVRLAGNEQISHALNRMVHVYPGGLLDVNTRTETLDTLWLDGGDATTTGTGRLTARNAYVEGSTASWTNSDTLIVGDAAVGSLSISQGGDVTGVNAYVGKLAGGNGSVTVAGSGSYWGHSGFIAIGEFGIGSMQVTSGALVDCLHATVGQSGTGTALVSGSLSGWAVADFLEVGNHNGGVGTLTIQNGGVVTNTDSIIGRNTGSQGTVIVNGVNSRWTSYGTMEVGISGAGTLEIENDGLVTVVQDMTINALGEVIVRANGNLQTSDLIAVDGGSLAMHSGASLASSGHVHLEDGATMLVDSGATCAATGWFIGDGPGATANLHVDGAGSVLSAANCCIDVGYGATGVVNITGGGRVESDSGGIGSWDPMQTGTQGTLVIDGTDAAGNPSSWIGPSGPHIALSPNSQGTVHILNGGLLATGGIAIGQAGSATVLVSGTDSSGDPSRLQATNVNLAIPAGSQAAVTASAGGRINTANLSLSNGGGTSSLTLTGAGSTLTQSGGATLIVGHATAGSAEINIQNNALFTTGTGAIMVNGTGAINIESGGVFDARGPITVNAGGEFNMLGGTLKATAFNGSMLNQAGTLAPGHSLGVTAISGNYTQQAGATLQIEIGGIFPGDWDEAIVQGNALVDGTLHVVLIDGFQPVTGNTFTILTTNVGNVAGTFDTLIAPSGMEVTYSPHAITLEMTTLPCPADVSPGGGDGAVNINDLLEVINGWGSCAVPCPPRCAADISPIPAGDCQVNINDLLEVINSWGPCP